MVIWWRGRGLWIPFIIALPILSATASHGSPFRLAIGLAVAAGLIHLMRDWLGENSAVYSISVRIWPFVLGGLAILTLGAAIGGGGYSQAPRVSATNPTTSTTIAKSAASPALAKSSAPAPQTETPPAQPESGVAAFESWAHRTLGPGEFRYVSNDEIWISLTRAPDHADSAALDAATRYRQLMAKSTPTRIVLFANNTRLAQSTQ